MSSKVYDGLATIWLPGHLHLAGTTYLLCSAFQATLAFTPSPVLRCNFPPQSLCPRHSSLCLEGSSHIPPYLPPALALLLAAQEIILRAQEWINSAILCSPMHLPPLLCGPPPRVSFILRASSLCPFHQKRLRGHEVMGRDLPFMFIAVMPGSMTLNKYLWN